MSAFEKSKLNWANDEPSSEEDNNIEEEHDEEPEEPYHKSRHTLDHRNQRDSRNNRNNFSNNQLPNQPPYAIYVGNLNYNVTENIIGMFFVENKCDVKDVKVHVDDQGKSKGFAHIEFENVESLKLGLSFHSYELEGRPIKIDLVRPKSQFSAQQRAGDHRGGDRGDHRGGDRGDHRGGDRGDHRGGDRGDHRGGDNRSGDHRGGANRSGAHRGGDHRGGDHGGDNKGGRGDGYEQRRDDRGNRGGDMRLGDNRGGRGGYEQRASAPSQRDEVDWGRGAKKEALPPRERDNGGRGGRGEGRGNPSRSEGNVKKEVESNRPAERPKLNLAPRSIPIEAIGAPIENASSIFGDAKPNDAAAFEAARRKKIEEEKKKRKNEKELAAKKELDNKVEEVDAISEIVISTSELAVSITETTNENSNDKVDDKKKKDKKVKKDRNDNDKKTTSNVVDSTKKSVINSNNNTKSKTGNKDRLKENVKLQKDVPKQLTDEEKFNLAQEKLKSYDNTKKVSTGGGSRSIFAALQSDSDSN